MQRSHAQCQWHSRCSWGRKAVLPAVCFELRGGQQHVMVFRPSLSSNRTQRLWRQCLSSRQGGRQSLVLRPQASSPGAMPPPSAGGVPGRSSSAPLGGSSQVPAEVAAMSNEHEGDGERRESFVTRIMKPLQDFGFGRSSFWEGGVGLFVFSGIAFAIVLVSWARSGQLGRRGKGYQCVLEFPLACGITVGTPVRIRGVPVGSVLSVNPSLEKVEVLVEVKKATTVIPRNSLIEANQSGLIAEPLIDITPQLPIPDYKASPTDLPECEAEGKVVCSQGHIKGQPGVAMDDLVYICTKIARQMDAQGLDRIFDAAEAATAAAEEARPLLTRIVELVGEVTPLLAELRQGGMVANLEELTRSASDAAADIHRLQNEVLTPDNVAALRDSVVTLTKTLEHIEGITGDLGGFTGDARNKANLKQLIEALSRIIAD